MNIKLKNIAQLFSNVRTRMIILATMSILVVSVVMGLKRLMHKAPPVSNTTVQLKDAPSIQSVPGGLTESPSVDYKRLQEQQNRKQAQIAEQTGQSAIPTLLDTNDFQHQTQGGTAANSPCYQPCSPCYQEAISSGSSAATQSSLQPSPLRVGTLVYDTHGKVIGRLGADGQVRDENGKIIGRVGPDGLVRDLKNQAVIGSAALPAAGDSVYDAAGRIIGQVGVDGKIRDAQGYVIGSVGPDGIARNLKGGILGRVVPAKPMTRTISGAPVFDAKNHLLGTANAKGQLLDAQGKVLGELGTDGVLRDAQGRVIGKTGVSQAGAPVNDAQGHLVGLVDADGKIINSAGHVITDHPDAARRTKIPVYDAQGRFLGDSNQQGEIEDTHHRVLGKLNEQGIVYDQNGHILGKTGIPQAGAPVYDAKGHLIGRVLPNGDVLDSDGQKIGHLDSEGVVRAMDGHVLGQASLRNGSVGGFIAAPVPGAPVYDHQGQFIGTVGTDGKVRNDQGQVLGAIDATGTLYGLHHERLGQVGIAAPGTPVYDAQGHLIGTAGPQGIIRNSQGQRIATLGADGRVLNPQGQVIGRVTPPRVSQNEPGSSVPRNDLLSNALTPPNVVRLEPTDSGKPTNPELQAILDRQQQQLSAQKAEQLQQQMQAAMSTQATQLFTAWTSPLQQYVAGVPTPNASTAFMSGKGYPGGLAPSTSTAPMAVKAGTIMYAVLLTSVNTDEPGPVLAKIVEGKFKGARLIGTLTNQGQRVLLSFNTMTLPKVSQSIPINTVAIDNNTARTALSSETDNHYWLRYGTLFASAFIQGYGQSFLNTGNSMSIFNFDNKPIDLSPKQRVLVGLGQVGTQYAAALGSVFNTPPTVHVYSGTPIGILFVADLPALPDK